MPEQSCIFCEIVAGRADASVVYENEHVLAFLDLFSINEGHTLVVPKRHATQLDDMDADTGMQVFAVAHRLARWIRESGIKCEGREPALVRWGGGWSGYFPRPHARFAEVQGRRVWVQDR